MFASFLCFAQESRPGCDEGCAHALLDRFVELGGNFIDTADVYQFGMSETIIGRWIEKHPKLRSKVKVCIQLYLYILKLRMQLEFEGGTCSCMVRQHKLNF